MKKEGPRSVLDIILRRFDQEASEVIYPALYVENMKRLEEALLRDDLPKHMDGGAL